MSARSNAGRGTPRCSVARVVAPASTAGLDRLMAWGARGVKAGTRGVGTVASRPRAAESGQGAAGLGVPGLVRGPAAAERATTLGPFRCTLAGTRLAPPPTAVAGRFDTRSVPAVASGVGLAETIELRNVTWAFEVHDAAVHSVPSPPRWPRL